MGFIRNLLNGGRQRSVEKDVVIITKKNLTDQQRLKIVGDVYEGIKNGSTKKAISKKIMQDTGIYTPIIIKFLDEEIDVII